MPVVNDYHAVKEIYQEAAERSIALPGFCAEDRETVEAILASVSHLGAELGVADLPIIISWTSRYPARAQATLVSASGEAELGTQLMLSDLQVYAGDSSPYRNLRILPHLDHGFPWLDGDILDRYADRFASVMCDASEKSFQENIELTARYVEKVKGRVVVEGAVDEIYSEEGAEKNELTSVEKAREFLDRTGVDILVPNVGTEHRKTSQQVVYAGEQARKISGAVGKILCLHGTSSVKKEHIPGLPDDGFIKINIYTTLAVHGGQAVAREVLGSIGDIFNEAEIHSLIDEGVLGKKALKATSAGPQLNNVANALRRDAWFGAVKEQCLHYMELLNYQNWRA